MNRIKGLDLVRVLCTYFIVAFHFYSYSNSQLTPFLAYANGYWGGTLNAIFFALSGYVLQAKYGSSLGKIRVFYYKRWKMIIPPYIVVFLSAYMGNVAKYGSFFYYDIPKYRLIFSFLGVDGYAQWFCQTYFITGVWFIGAILFLYAIYPLLNKLARTRLKYIFLFLLIVAFLLLLKFSVIPAPIDINPVTCVLSFYIGMLLFEKTSLIKSKITFIICTVVCLGLLFVTLKGNHVIKEMIMGYLMFISIFNIGNHLGNFCSFKVITRLSKTSYYSILIHLPLIHKVLEGWNSENSINQMFVLIAIILSLIILSDVLNVVMGKIYDSKLFSYLDLK